MSGWKSDRGQTTLPCIFIPFNEIDEKSQYVPIRVGMSVMKWNKVDFLHALDNDGHMSFPAAPEVSGKYMYLFQDNNSVQRFSRHDAVLSPAANVGKHIVTFFKVKIGAAPAGKALTLIMFSAYDGVTGKGGWLLRYGTTSKNVTLQTAAYATSGASALSTPSGAGKYEPETWQQVMIDQHVVSETSIVTRVWLADADGELIDGGVPIIVQTFVGALPELRSGSCGLGFGGGASFDFKDFLALTTTDDPDPGILLALRQWFRNPNNEYQFPDFLRAPVAKAAPRQVEHYASYWSLNGVESRIDNMYDFWMRWGVQNSAFDGIHLGLGINAFQPTPGGYLVTELREFADWCHLKGIKLKILINDQTYLTATELPDHFPHWKKRYFHQSSGTIQQARAGMYWVGIDAFDMDAEVSRPDWPAYDPARADEGAYRMLHHIWTITHALKDKPAFAGITLGETSGSAIGDRDKSEGNFAGQSNRSGIYGITDGGGNYLLDKCYTMRKQRVYHHKAMRMVAGQLKGRPDVRRSLQINYIRYSIPGNHAPTYNKATKNFNFHSASLARGHMFELGDAMFLLGNTSTTLAAGMDADTPYYVVWRDDYSWRVAATPGGTPIEFNTNVNSDIWVSTIDHHMELRRDKARDVSVHNGYQLCEVNREIRLLAEGMHQYGFVVSGPDIITAAVENALYYEGPYSSSLKQYSPVEIRLDMLHGRRWFSDLGPMAACEIQGQDSTYQGIKNAILTQILPMYGPSYGVDDYSLRQVYDYAVDRLQVNNVVWFLSNENAQKALPDLINVIST